jgi:large repetitive protein
VTNVDGQAGSLPNGFTYIYPAPTITSVTPASGYSTGGTAIAVNGTNFYPGATLTIGGLAVTGLVRVNATRLTAVTPAGPAGPADVVVTNTDAQSVTRTGGFTWVPSPSVTAISPNHGPVQGGTLVTLTGTNFLEGASVFIGGVPAFAVTVTSPTTATAVTNSSGVGTFDVRLVNPDTQAATLPMAYTFDPAPTLTAVAPSQGTTAGGDTVTLTGTGFLAGASVVFGTTAATSVTVVSSTQVTAVTPARSAGVVSVTVRNTDGQYAELPRSYRFVTPPAFDSLSPVAGDVAGGTLVTLTGSGFAPTARVLFGGTESTEVTYVSETSVTAVTPPHARGAVDVVIDVDGARSTRTAAFTYTLSAPTLTQVAPLSGPTAGGVMLTLTGTGFADGATITVGGAEATSVVVVSPNLARAVVPAHAAGVVDVVLTNVDQQAATLTGGFTYVAPVDGTSGTIADGGSGAIGMEPIGGGGGQGGVSCGCTSVDGSMVSLLGFVAMTVLARRRRR